jgi:phosphoribosylaminoimidazole (AIR) synthetase
LTDIGSFGGGYLLSGWKRPVLVSSADGVGTKLKVAFQSGRHDTIGEDLVNHCVNDIAVQGAVPLFFLDYYGAGHLNAKIAGEVVGGIARGCRNNGCALIGGETAEMPGMYKGEEYDLAGFIVGAVEQKAMLDGSGIGAEIRMGSWPVLPIFERLRAIGNLGAADYRRTFNLGIGMVVVVSKRNLSKAWALLDRMGERSFDIGLVVKARQRRVKYVG